MWQTLKYWLKVLAGKEILVSVQKKTETRWYGNQNAGFYVATALVPERPVVYSFGVGEDISFDLEMIKRHNAAVYAFDPTPKSQKFIRSQQLPENFHFFDYGIYDHDGTLRFFLPEDESHVSGTIYNRWKYDESKIRPIDVPVKKFASIVGVLGHRKIDVLKIDIEGSEYAVLQQILDSGVEITQILIEFHHRFEGISKSKTKEAIALLNSKGFQIAGIAETREEFTFVRN
jgi:FkbM family methyltransferase